jgi:ABC-type multidrug transport system fused ATPase/permease subunit
MATFAQAGAGDSPDRYPPRKWYRKVPFVRTKPIDDPVCQPPLAPEKQDASSTASTSQLPLFPEMDASWYSLATFSWLHRVLRIGYTRPLNAEELYAMPAHRSSKEYAQRLEEAWRRRSDIAEAETARRKSQPNKKRRSISSHLMSLVNFKKASKREDDEVKPSLMWSLNDVIFSWFWVGGLMKLVGDLALITSPLLVRSIIDTLSEEGSYAQKRGFGLSAGLFVLLTVSVFGNVHGFYRSYSTGIALRAALIHTVYLRGTKLSERARLTGLGVGKMMSLISADASRIDFCCGYFHMAWTSMVQIVVCLGLMIYSLSYSALPGFALVAVMYPLQNVMVKKLFALRKRSMPFTDARIKAVVETVASVRLIKTYAWESPMLSKIGKFRASEMSILRKRLLLRSLNTAISFTIPTLAAVVSFVCYVGVGNGLDSGVIFSSLTFFLLLRTPLQMLPVCLSAIADAGAALERLSDFMQAELRGPDPPIDHEMVEAVSVRDAAFLHHDDTVETSVAADGIEKAGGLPSNVRLRIDELTVQRGSLVVVVGGVGSGKSSLLRALLGDMQEVSPTGPGDLRLGGDVAYCPQSAWLLSATVRENIVFGRAFDETRYQDTIRKCCLASDFAMLVDGDMTVVGEKGVSLSGGQKQRISLARAVYSGAERPLRFLDDCFSALDAHVGAEVFRNVILDETQRSRKRDNARPPITHVLVTHALAFVRHADHVVYLESGSIREQGGYKELMALDGPFARLMKTGLKQSEEEQEQDQELPEAIEKDSQTVPEEKKPDQSAPDGPAAPARQPRELMQKEERLLGSVTWRTYLDYILLGNAPLTAPLFIASIVMYQAATILSPLWLSWWEDVKYPQLSTGVYMGVYAALGIGQSLGLFCMSASFALFAYYTSYHLHARASKTVLYAPLSFFDTTPQGRITHRFSKDIDAVDNVVGETLRLFISTTVQALGSVILVTIILPYFLAIAAVVVICYVWVGMYYRPAARELRRLNNVLRSKIYEHFSESLTGISTVRAYGALASFREDNARRIDSENRAYWLSIACQRWMNLRLDFMGATLCFAVALLVVGLRGTISSSSGGVVLSYMVTVQSVFGQMIRQSAEIENNMNSIERLLHYTRELPQEAGHELKSDKELEKSMWPQEGRVKFNALTASHRPELPPALRGVELDIKPGQRIGVVGRTGAGKSTLLSALLRLMEPTSGSVSIDGVDISTIGLNLLRRKISVISQDAVLFAGTLRYNLDPFQEHDDVDLWRAMKQARLVGDGEGSTSYESRSTDSRTIGETEGADAAPAAKSAATIKDIPITAPPSQDTNAVPAKSGVKEEPQSKNVSRPLHLDMEISADGSNLSQGQRSLVSIARALVKQSRIVILDEATASVDVHTDSQIQVMLQEVLRGCTFITVAHRLDTIVGGSDLVVVMDQGRVAEVDGVEALYLKGHQDVEQTLAQDGEEAAPKDATGLFRRLCESAGITLEDIRQSRQTYMEREKRLNEAQARVGGT